jgi:bifunctional non-homologous end joining protein LigD
MHENNTTPAAQTVTLFNRTPGRDAVYILELKEVDGRWQLFYSNGRRGSTLTTKPVTQPVAYEIALKAFESKKRSKLAGGYHPAEYFGEGDASAQTHVATSDGERETGVFPQLLTEADEREADEFIRDSAWWMQEKFDGKRIILDVTSGRVRAINRRGLVCGISESIRSAAVALSSEFGDFRLDGEAMGDTFVVFDCHSINVYDLSGCAYSARLSNFTGLVRQMPPALRLADVWMTETEKAEHFARIKAEGREGVVFKRHAAPYTAGRPNSGGDQRKVKFTATVTVVVERVNAKRSFSMLAYVDGQPTNIGNCTVPANRELPTAGQFIEVRYLYSYPGGCLFQPRYVDLRDDLTLADVAAQPALKYKAEDGEDCE